MVFDFTNHFGHVDWYVSDFFIDGHAQEQYSFGERDLVIG